MHGDYHVMNTLIAPDLPARVVAILDWETATIGDPLLDLAGFCEIWSMVAGDDGASRASLVDRYRSRQGIAPIEDLAYYLVLYTFRLAVLLEGIYQRSLHDLTRDDQHDMGERALASVDRALVLMADAT
jgi:aminoglycoside phosphotransferase (APT) family kinase protein